MLAQEIAEAAGVSKGSYSKYERDIDSPREETVAKLAAFFGVTPAYLRYGVRSGLSTQEGLEQLTGAPSAVATDLPAPKAPAKKAAGGSRKGKR